MPNEAQTLARYSDYEVAGAQARFPQDREGEPLQEGGLISLLEFGRLLARHRGLLVLATILGGVVGFLLSLPQTPVYRASATIEIQGLNRDFLGMQNVSPTDSGGSMTADLATQAELLKSRTLIEEVVDSLDLSSEDLSTDGGRLATWRRAMGLPEVDPEERFEQAVATARDSVSVSVQGTSRLIAVGADSTDPVLAAKFANTLADVFIRSNVESRWSATQYTEDWLDMQLDDLRVKLENSEDELQSYARHTGLIFTANQESLAEGHLGQLQELLAEARADRIAKQSQYELVENNLAMALEIVENPYRGELARLRQELASLTSTFTDDYPKVKSLKARIDELRQAAKAAQTEVLNSRRAEYEAALRRERLIEADYHNQARLVSELARKSIQYNILKREVDTNRELYDNLLQKGKEARLSAAMQASPIRVVDRAIPPSTPFKPNHAKNSVIGLFLGLVAGGAFILARDRLDRTIKGPGDAEFHLQIRELGLIPAAGVRGIKPAGKGRLRLKIRRESPAQSSAGMLGIQSEASDPHRNGSMTQIDNESLLHLSDEDSHIAESFRSVLTSILFGARGASPPRCIVITSAFPQEGKSSVVSNLAAAIAAINRSVLVIDGDMRRPWQHRIFGSPNEVGLTDLLIKPTSLTLNGSRNHPAVFATDVPGLDLVPSGRGSVAPSNILHSPRLEELLKWARLTYDFVLIDTPPLVQLPDARLMARLSDGVVLVIDSGSTERDAATAAVEQLRQDGANLVGAILNRWNPKTSDYGYYSERYYESYVAGETGNGRA